jgi:hypothetical protein
MWGRRATGFISVALALAAAPALATPLTSSPGGPGATGPGTVAIDALNDSLAADITFVDGSTSESNEEVFVSQFTATYEGGAGGLTTFYTFCIDLDHSVADGQTYAVYLNNSLAPAYSNGAQMSYIYDTYGLTDLADNPDQAAAVQIAEWDLSINSHTPTTFVDDGAGVYSSGDPGVFNISFPTLDSAAVETIVADVNSYLGAAAGATANDAWLDASAAGTSASRGQSLLLPAAAVPEPPAVAPMMFVLALLGAWCRRRAR